MNKPLRITLKTIFYLLVAIGISVVVGYKYITYKWGNDPEVQAKILHEDNFQPISIELYKIRNAIILKEKTTYQDLVKAINNQLPEDVQSEHWISSDWKKFNQKWEGI